MINESYSFSEIEKKFIKHLVKSINFSTEVIFEDAFNEFIINNFSNLKLIIEKEKIIIKFCKISKFEFINKHFIKSHIVKNRDKLIKLIDLVDFLNNKGLVYFYQQNSSNSNNYSIRSKNFIDNSTSLKEIKRNNELILKILKSNFQNSTLINELISKNFETLETKNLKITQKALIISILFNCITLLPKGDSYVSTSKTNIYNSYEIKTSNKINSLNFGTTVKKLKTKNKMSLIKYEKDDIEIIGWIESKNLENIGILEKLKIKIIEIF